LACCLFCNLIISYSAGRQVTECFVHFLPVVEAVRSGYRRVYGVRKTWLELRRRGVEAGRDQVAGVMRQHGLEGKLRGRKKRTTIPGESAVERAASVDRAKG
jgi:putative transposase